VSGELEDATMTCGEPVVLDLRAARIAGERWAAPGPAVVFPHAGVTDRRAWNEVTGRLAGRVTLAADDRRGYGQSPPAAEPFTHLGDLLAVLDQLAVGPVLLSGNSAGGGLALDAALAAPEWVAGLALACGDLDAPFIRAASAAVAAPRSPGRWRGRHGT
jgi:pimeloyl-ACP methyl ester carboxylesterase